MAKLNGKLIGIFMYLVCLSFIFRFNWVILLDLNALLAVIVGVIILTISQLNRKTNRQKIMHLARWNAFLAGLLTSLLSLLSLISDPGMKLDGYLFKVMEALIPLIYGSVLYLLLDFLSTTRTRNPLDHSQEPLQVTLQDADNALSIRNIHEVLRERGFSPREVHVALKIMEDLSNKEIAQQLYISEPTVKKHIQNMFKKCDATDRRDFIELVNRWLHD